jgi:hypothetical protein
MVTPMVNTLAYYYTVKITNVKSFIVHAQEFTYRVKYCRCSCWVLNELMASTGNPNQYNRPPCTNLFRSPPFDIANIIYFFYKKAALMKRSIVLSLPLQLLFHGLNYKNMAIINDTLTVFNGLINILVKLNVIRAKDVKARNIKRK